MKSRFGPGAFQGLSSSIAFGCVVGSQALVITLHVPVPIHSRLIIVEVGVDQRVCDSDVQQGLASVRGELIHGEVALPERAIRGRGTQLVYGCGLGGLTCLA